MDDTGLINEALAVTQELADQVRLQLLEAFDGVRAATLKGDGSLVTQTDLEADRIIGEVLRSHFPGHEIVSEELDTVYEGARWCWVVDPLDGTTNFVQGVPIWAISIALLHRGQPVMGLVDVPPLGLRYHAVKGEGAFENGKPIHVRSDVVRWENPARLQNELFAVCTRTVRDYRLPHPLKPRVLGVAAYNFCLVANGTALAAMEAMPKIWDMAAGWLLVHEAGGVVHQLAGASVFPLKPGRDYARVKHPYLSAANEALAHELARRMRRKRARREML
jgi:myo-inositol-1(or 4)-monophosphatase